MNSLVSSLLSYVLLYRYWMLAGIVYLATLGVPLPSNTVVLAVGAFASQGFFNIFLALFVALVANVLGDCTCYAVTRIWGERFMDWSGASKFRIVKKLDRFLRDNAGWTIFISRFNGLPSIVVNLLAGLAEVPFGKFLLYDVIGNITDNGLFLLAGYLLGILWQEYTVLTTIVSTVAFTILMIFSLYKLLKPEKEGKTI